MSFTVMSFAVMSFAVMTLTLVMSCAVRAEGRNRGHYEGGGAPLVMGDGTRPRFAVRTRE